MTIAQRKKDADKVMIPFCCRHFGHKWTTWSDEYAPTLEGNEEQFTIDASGKIHRLTSHGIVPDRPTGRQFRICQRRYLFREGMVCGAIERRKRSSVSDLSDASVESYWGDIDE